MKKFLLNSLILTLPAIVIGGILALAGDLPNGARLFFLSLGGGALVYLAKFSPLPRFFGALAALWWASFLLHSIALSSTWFLYDSSADAYFIVQSIANTSLNETAEYAAQNAVFLALVAVCALGFCFAYYILVKNLLNPLSSATKLNAGLIFLCALAWISMPTRAVAPLFYWQSYAKSVVKFKAQTAKHALWHEIWRKNATQLGEFSQESQTIVLIISESLTSANLSVCGYARATSPRLAAHLGELRVFCDAYSAYPYTLGAITSMLTDASDYDRPPARSVLADAQAAGFKLFWLSNQDDAHIASLFGAFCDVAIYNNKRSGRASRAKDEELLPLFKAALSDAAPRKFIILHLIGSHPNYAARYPESFEIFPSDDAAAEAKVRDGLDRAGAGIWTRYARDKYDNSVVYQDFILENVLNSLKNDTATRRGLVFISDHGNEVGHERDFAGHSPNTRAGYRIPVVLWSDQTGFSAGLDERAIDATELGANLLYLMGLGKPVWTAPNYDWNASGLEFNGRRIQR